MKGAWGIPDVREECKRNQYDFTISYVDEKLTKKLKLLMAY